MAFGSFDMFHVGHLRALRAASESCERLVIMVATDLLVEKVTGSVPVISHGDRLEVVGGFGLAWKVAAVDSVDVTAALSDVGATVVFVSPPHGEPRDRRAGGNELEWAHTTVSEPPELCEIAVRTTESPALGGLARHVVFWRVGPSRGGSEPVDSLSTGGHA